MAYNSENYYKKKIEELIYKFPNEFQQYASYLLKDKNMTYSEAYIPLKTIESYYNVLSMNLHKIAFKINPKDFENSSDITNSFIKKSLADKQQIHLADFYEWLKENKLVTNLLVKYPESNSKVKKPVTNNTPRKKNIKSADDVHFFKDDNKKYAQTTIDYKYSLEKNFKDKYADYTYKIHDNENDRYFLDEDGNILEFEYYKDAREFVKKLYPSKN